MTYGASVKQHLLANRDVLLVLLTDGSESGECDNLRNDPYGHANFDLTDGVTGNYFAVPLNTTDRAACTAHRDGEFNGAAAEMQNNVGAPSSTIGEVTAVIRSDRKTDGTLTKAYVASVINEYQALYPAASFKGMTYKEMNFTEGHPDHDVIGEALRDEYNADNTFDVRLYVKPALWDNITVAQTTVRESINTVLDEYRTFGQHSVVGEFCEQYGLAKSQRATLDNGRTCPTVDYPKITGGADSKYHTADK